MTDLVARPISRTAHQQSVQMQVPEIVGRLQAVLGQSLLGVIVDRENRAIQRWISGVARPPQNEERRLRDTFQVVELMASVEHDDVVRAWFMGMNPQLDDESPSEALAAGRARDVMAAARAFINAG